MKPDFSGYATKAGLKCSDGRVITPKAFEHQNNETVPLVWRHDKDNLENILGYAKLEHRDDGVYCYGYFNDTENGQKAKALVLHGSLDSLSIRANQLVERSKQVLHGMIREVSLVVAGANPGAKIDNVVMAHGDEYMELDDEAIITTGAFLTHEDTSDFYHEGEEDDDDDDDATVMDVYESMSDDQKTVLHYMVGVALEEANNVNHNDQDSNHLEGSPQTMNVFESNKKQAKEETLELSHADVNGIIQDAIEYGSLKTAVRDYGLAHGINDIERLFPEAQLVDGTPQMDDRDQEWVEKVLGATKKTPFSRIKTQWTEGLTLDVARARGYIKGNMKKEEFFGIANRSTTPQTIYKKQKFDRDDLIDITSFDLISWVKAEMRGKLREELARAILLGDGRPVEDPAHPGEPNPDKIKEEHIRPVVSDVDLFVHKAGIDFDGSTPTSIVDQILQTRKHWRGTGAPTLFTTEDRLTKLLLARDTLGRRFYRTVSDLAAELRVASIEPIEIMEEAAYEDVVGILVNMADYTVGTDKGGETTFFEDFDIDFNQHKYLYETRCSGALTKIRSAVVINQDDAVTPPEEDPETP
jgi:HK97 family phage prohead protease